MVTTTVVVPQYPNCLIGVSYVSRQCTDEQGNPEQQLSDFQILSIGADCNQLFSDFIALSGTALDEWFINLFKDMQEDASDQLFSNYITLLGEELYHEAFCSNGTTANLLTKVSFYNDACRSSCMTWDGVQLGLESNECGEICCRQTFTYCLINGTEFEDATDESKWTKTGKAVFGPVDEKACEEFPLPLCENALFQRPCTASCGKEKQK